MNNARLSILLILCCSALQTAACDYRDSYKNIRREAGVKEESQYSKVSTDGDNSSYTGAVNVARKYGACGVFDFPDASSDASSNGD
jgi:hypothetical protein